MQRKLDCTVDLDQKIKARLNLPRLKIQHWKDLSGQLPTSKMQEHLSCRKQHQWHYEPVLFPLAWKQVSCPHRSMETLHGLWRKDHYTPLVKWAGLLQSCSLLCKCSRQDVLYFSFSGT